MKAIIFAGGVIEDYSYIDLTEFEKSLVIVADGGYRHTVNLGLTPNIFIGDNDSWNNDFPVGIDVIKCPTEKDYTDTNRCIDYAIEKGCCEIDIYGGLGGRLDHEYSNYCLLAYGLKRGVKIRLLDKNNEIWMEDKPFKIKKNDKKYVSFFPYGGVVEKFSIKGLKYETDNMSLDFCQAQASSNEFADDDVAEVSFKNGILIVMRCNDIG